MNHKFTSKILTVYAPEIAKEWHPILNGNLKPEQFTFGSKRKVWWQCSKGHSYEAIIQARTRSKSPTNCPYCSNRKLLPENSFAAVYPELAKEWHPTLNGELTPQMVPPVSGKKVWWQCSKNHNHKWKATIANRKNGTGCPVCQKSASTSYSEQLIFYSMSKIFPTVVNRYKINGAKKELDIFIPSLNIGIEYDGYYYHKDNENTDRAKNKYVFDNSIRLIRIREQGLSEIADYNTYNLFVERKRNEESLKTAVHTILNYLKNNYRLSESTIKKINNLDINKNINKSEVLYAVSESTKKNSLLVKYPEVAKEWHPKLNGDLRPEHVTHGSERLVWWQCNEDKQHVYQAPIYKRTKQHEGCPYCAGKRCLPKDSIGILYPQIAAEWHPTLNKMSSTEIAPNSIRKIWWQSATEPSRIWNERVKNRVKKQSL